MREINAALADPNVEARLADLGGAPMPMKPAEFGALVATGTEEEIGQGGRVLPEPAGLIIRDEALETSTLIGVAIEVADDARYPGWNEPR